MGKKKLRTGFAIFKTYEGVDNLVDFFEYKLRRMVADYYNEGDNENGELLEDLRIQNVTNKAKNIAHLDPLPLPVIRV